MSKWTAFAGSSGAMVGTAVVVVAAAIGAGLYINANRSASTDTTQSSTVEQPAVAAVAPAPTQTPETTTQAAIPLDPPSIDEVRVEPDGLTVIAGRAAPGSKVAVLLDGAENTETTTDDGGSFAAITILPPSPKAQVLTVVQRVGMDEIASVDEVILAPQAQPAPATGDEPTRVAEPPTTPSGSNDVATADATSPTEPLLETAPLPEVANAAPKPDVAADVSVASTQPPPTDPSPAEPDVLADAPTLSNETQEEVAATAPDAVEEGQSEPATAVTVLRSSADGIEVLGTAPPEALDNIAIDSISYSDEGDVELAGRAQPEADAVRVYVNNAPIADIDVSEDGNWKGELPQIDTGTYTLRVDELNDAGQVTSRVETPFRREDPDVLAQASTGDAPATQITVQTGNTLWAIARDRYGEGLLYVQVFDANRDRIRNPDLIFPGQVFQLPN